MKSSDRRGRVPSLPLCISLGVISCLLIALVNGYWFSYLFPVDPYDMRRVIQLILLISIPVLGYCFFEVRENFIRHLGLLPKWISQLWIIFFGLGMISALYALYPQFALLQWGLYLLMLLDIFILAGFCSALGSWARYWLYGTLFLSILFLIIGRLLLYALYGEALKAGLKFDPMMVITPTFMQLRFLAQVLTWTWPIMVLPLMQDSIKLRVKGKILIFILAGFLWSVMILNNSRALYLEWIGLMSVALIFFSKAGRRWVFWQMMVGLLGLFIYFIQYQVILKLCFLHLPLWGGSDGLGPSGSSLFVVDDRLVLYHAAWLLIKSHPILGVGPMHYPQASWVFQNAAAHPHDVWLLIASEWGLLAFFCFTSILVYGMWKFFRALKGSLQISGLRSKLPEGMLLFLTLLGALFHASVSGILVMPVSQGLMVFLVGWSVCFYFNNISNPHSSSKFNSSSLSKKSHPKAIEILMALAFLLAISLIIWGVWPVWGRWVEIIDIYLQRTHVTVLEPNFWLQGRIQFWI